MRRKIIVGTRGSALALTQTGMVIESLKGTNADIEFEIKKITTTGDRILDKTLDKIGGKGLFVYEIERALKEGEIDLAVHSLKDIPNGIDPYFRIMPVLKREDPRDVLLSREGLSFHILPEGAVVGTSSLRRIAQLRNIRNDLSYEPIRGNIDTRIKRMKNGEFDAIVLAAAGLLRMGWEKEITEYFPIDQVIPAVGQGALCAQYRSEDTFVEELLLSSNEGYESRGILAERIFLEEVNGSCSVAMGAYGEISQGILKLIGFYSEHSDSTVKPIEVSGSPEDYVEIGKRLAVKVKGL